MKFKMKRYAESQKSENNNPERKEYSLLNNNCGTFAIDVLNQDTNVKKDAPKIVDPRPVSIVEEYQDTFTPISYNEKNNQTFVREK